MTCHCHLACNPYNCTWLIVCHSRTVFRAPRGQINFTVLGTVMQTTFRENKHQLSLRKITSFQGQPFCAVSLQLVFRLVGPRDKRIGGGWIVPRTYLRALLCVWVCCMRVCTCVSVEGATGQGHKEPRGGRRLSLPTRPQMNHAGLSPFPFSLSPMSPTVQAISNVSMPISLP